MGIGKTLTGRENKRRRTMEEVKMNRVVINYVSYYVGTGRKWFRFICHPIIKFLK